MEPLDALPDFAVIDTETTGLSSSRGDRVLEIAVLRLDAEGVPQACYETLLNPRRSVGATHIHGITARDILDAPSFEEIAPDVLAMLSGCVLVAHNMEFDFGFLVSECQRAGLHPGDPLRLCTVQASRRILPTLFSHRLSVVCESLGIALASAHSAMEDCAATAQIFWKFLQHRPVHIPEDLHAFRPRGSHLFRWDGSGSCARRSPYPRKEARQASEDSRQDRFL